MIDVRLFFSLVSGDFESRSLLSYNYIWLSFSIQLSLSLSLRGFPPLLPFSARDGEESWSRLSEPIEMYAPLPGQHLMCIPLDRFVPERVSVSSPFPLSYPPFVYEWTRRLDV